MNIYIADASPLKSGDVFMKYYNEMPKDRRIKVDKLRNDSAKRLSLCAGILLNKALSDLNRIELSNHIISMENSRPGFDKDYGIDFNLSHSGNMAMCVISESKVGCDIQLMKPTDGKIATRFFTDPERDYVFAVDDPSEINDRFYRIWARKEAYTKVTGEGISKDFKSFDVLDADSFWEYSYGDYRMCVAGNTKEKICFEVVEI